MNKHVTIMELPAEERPREKLVKHGPAYLTNAELLGIIIAQGTREKTAVEVCRELLAHYDNRLAALLNAKVRELAGNKELLGIGTAKACQIVAALELARRIPGEQRDEVSITTPGDAAAVVMGRLAHLSEEHFYLLLLDAKKKLIACDEISVGTLNASLVHPREVFLSAVKHHSSSLILVHNHPSGDPQPSREDIAVTKRLLDAGEIMGIPVVDHLVIGAGRFVSLREEGLI